MTQPIGNEWLLTAYALAPGAVGNRTGHLEPANQSEAPDSRQLRIAQIHEHPIDARLSR